MSSQGPLGAGSGSTSASTESGDLASGTNWDNPGNITASDTSYATVNLVPGDNSSWLVAEDFGFSIPLVATVTGIQVDVLRSDGGSGLASTISALLVKAGLLQDLHTDYGGTGGTWPNSDAYESYGDSTDMWGNTWAPADINASDFGFGMRTVNDARFTTSVAQVDFIQITVSYTGGAQVSRLALMGVGS